jgi:hypothetical protein
LCESRGPQIDGSIAKEKETAFSATPSQSPGEKYMPFYTKGRVNDD